VSVERLRETAAGKDLFSMASLVGSLTGMDRETFSPTELETALYRGITRFLKKAGRDPLSAGAVLDYLWQCSIEAMNLSTLYYGRELDREALAAELVQ
jgi:vacuolar-type H+-ATPase subunit C/Vma6